MICRSRLPPDTSDRKYFSYHVGHGNQQGIGAVREHLHAPCLAGGLFDTLFLTENDGV
ncbi:predicted protein [Plenodomus lingam JN3]|uniref:Predicted protein n=1 Tax=Leptosphaeria maculans (strain JN3 / isolate v23.1.3 / race Av1-4-5-6-7-8) TaxID=985895 RepID=E4ZR26_LEPMJ|nr:predicted protein [Plenodomus lingam JN3]CBX93691.1 predicted protein [Plenodomus lingam JN3]